MIPAGTNNPAPRIAIAENVARNATMTSLEIAEMVGSRHDSVKRTIERLAGQGVIVQPPLVDEPGIDAMGRLRTTEVYRFSGAKGKRDSIVVVAQLSPEFTAALVDRWEALEKALAGSQPSNKLAGELAIMECFNRLLNPAPSSRVMMLAKIAEQNGLDAQFLPAYAVDAAANSDAGSSMPTKALTALLREHGIKYAPAAFNDRLAEAGILARLTRRNSKGETVGFWSVTSAGLEYGKNLTSPASPRETQPHWYVDRFADLVSLVLDRRVA